MVVMTDENMMEDWGCLRRHREQWRREDAIRYDNDDIPLDILNVADYMDFSLGGVEPDVSFLDKTEALMSRSKYIPIHTVEA